MVGRFGVIWWVQLWMMEAGVVLGGFVGLNQVLAMSSGFSGFHRDVDFRKILLLANDCGLWGLVLES